MPLNQEHLLIVDDEEMNRDMLSRRLERSGFQVEVARDGAEALRKIDERPWDLILLDQMMPERSGTDVLRELRARRSASELPVIMVTAVAESAKVAEALDAGANDYVTKPIDFTVTLARIRSQLSRKRDEAARRHNEEGYALAARASHDGFWDWDLVADRIDYSARWKEMLELHPVEVGDSPREWFLRVHPGDLPGLRRALDEHLERNRDAFECEYRMRTVDGRYLWMAGRGMAVFDDLGKPVRMAGSQSDITKRKTIDSLTGLPNHLVLAERIEAALQQTEPDYCREFAVLAINVDRLKLLNDSLGRGVGDELIVAFARRLVEVLHEYADCHSALVARTGGDEFAVLLEEIADSAAASGLATGILKAMRPAFRLKTQELFASASIGIAMRRRGHRTVGAVLHDADTALHAAKNLGRGRAALFDEPMRDRAVNRLQLESDLRVALGRGELTIYYQPRVDLHSEAICGFEALLRWNHPSRGLVAPDDFIPLAEETGMIREIGLWVLREACRQIQYWRYRFPRPGGARLDMAVNVSPVQLRDPELVNRVREILEETRLDPSALHLEVTESSILENLEEARRLLHALKQLGVGLKLDDFATGYSCLAYLKQLPFDSIKIDRSFMSEISTRHSEQRELVKTILNMAQNLRLGVIAEGVEDEHGAEALKEMGCRFAQGFYFSRPVVPAAIEILLAGESGREAHPK